MNKVHDFFNKTGNYLHQSFGIRIRTEIVRELVGAPFHLKILDVGCGNGKLSSQFIDNNYITFLDLSENMIDLVKENLDERYAENAKFFIGSFFEIDLEDNYDLILAVGLIAHVPSVNHCIERISSKLKQGGHAIIQFSNYNHCLTRLNIRNSKHYGYKINHIRYDELRDIIGINSMSIVSEIQFSFLLPGMGKLSERFLYWYARMIWKVKFFSRFGSDFIWYIEKV